MTPQIEAQSSESKTIPARPSRLVARQAASSVATDSSSIISYINLSVSTDSMMSHIGAHTVEVPAQFQSRQSANGKFQLISRCWHLAAGSGTECTARMVTIQGSRTEIVNTWIFPSDPSLHPVFAAEIIAVAPLTRVAFIDIQGPALNPPTREQVTVQTSFLRRNFNDLMCSEAPPAWATDESLGNYIYARDANEQQKPKICSCYLAFLSSYLNILKNWDSETPLSRSSERAVQELQAYQHHHQENSPGQKFLANLFGADWTNAFLTEFLLSLP